MTGRRPRIVVIAAGCLAAFAIAVAGLRPAVTDASWGDAEVANGTFVAKTIAKPMMSSCSLAPGTGGTNPAITVKWKFPTGTTYVVPSNVSYAVAKGGLASNLTPVTPGTNLSTTGPDASLTYTTKYGSGILTGLLGGSYLVGIRSVDSKGWTSSYATALASMGLGGTNPVCSVQP
jgi:hypothetical protein